MLEESIYYGIGDILAELSGGGNGDDNTNAAKKRIILILRRAAEEELTPRQQEVIRGLYFDCKSRAALALELQVCPSEICRLNRRAIERLRRSLRYVSLRS